MIPVASVTLMDQAGGLGREADTNAVGLLVFPDVRPGIFDLRVQTEGFDTYVLTDVRLEVGRRATTNFELQNPLWKDWSETDEYLGDRSTMTAPRR